MAGRPREFDPDAALERAMRVFWRQGYEGSSLADLTRAMGISSPSLYAAFGSKEELFARALDRYADGPAGYVLRALEAPTARGVAERLLEGAIELYTARGHPGGCLGVQGALACGPGAVAVRRSLEAGRAARERAIRRRLRRARKAGDLPADADPAGLARYLTTVVDGMSIRSAAGATRRELRQVAALALRCWPTPR